MCLQDDLFFAVVSAGGDPLYGAAPTGDEGNGAGRQFGGDGNIGISGCRSPPVGYV